VPGQEFRSLLVGGIASAVIVWLLSEVDEKLAWLYVVAVALLVLYAWRASFFPRLNQTFETLRS